MISGSESRLCDAQELRQMAGRRPETRFVQIEAGRSVHVDASEAFAREVQRFLAG